MSKTTYVIIVPHAQIADLCYIKSDWGYLYFHKEKPEWGEQSMANMLKNIPDAKTYAQRQGWLILPELPEGEVVTTMHNKRKFYLLYGNPTDREDRRFLERDGNSFAWAQNGQMAIGFTREEKGGILACYNN